MVLEFGGNSNTHLVCSGEEEEPRSEKQKWGVLLRALRAHCRQQHAGNFSDEIEQSKAGGIQPAKAIA
jgi:hypothetical protein